METRHQIPNLSIYIAVEKEKLRGKFVAKNGYVTGENGENKGVNN